MNDGKLRIVGCFAGLAGLLFASSALAQTPPDAAPAATTPAPPPEPAAAASTGGSAEVGMALPGAASEAAAVAGSSDHDSVVGRLAIGYLGRSSMTIGTLGGPGVANTGATIDTPVIGVRYWLSDMLGIDAGLGLGLVSGSSEQAGMNTDAPGLTVFMLHGGVPLSLASARHFSFQVVPELNVGIASSSVDIAGVETKVSGFHLDVGARAGAEIHFGFIDVPQLSLQGSVGLRLNMDSTSYEAGMVNASTSSTTISTTVGDNPWNIFTSNVAALYYF